MTGGFRTTTGGEAVPDQEASFVIPAPFTVTGAIELPLVNDVTNLDPMVSEIPELGGPPLVKSERSYAPPRRVLTRDLRPVPAGMHVANEDGLVMHLWPYGPNERMLTWQEDYGWNREDIAGIVGSIAILILGAAAVISLLLAGAI